MRVGAVEHTFESVESGVEKPPRELALTGGMTDYLGVDMTSVPKAASSGLVTQLPPGDQVAIAVGNQLRIANARFDAATDRLKPKSVFQQIMQDLDAMDAWGHIPLEEAIRLSRDLAAKFGGA